MGLGVVNIHSSILTLLQSIIESPDLLVHSCASLPVKITPLGSCGSTILPLFNGVP